MTLSRGGLSSVFHPDRPLLERTKSDGKGGPLAHWKLPFLTYTVFTRDGHSHPSSRVDRVPEASFTRDSPPYNSPPYDSPPTIYPPIRLNPPRLTPHDSPSTTPRDSPPPRLISRTIHPRTTNTPPTTQPPNQRRHGSLSRTLCPWVSSSSTSLATLIYTPPSVPTFKDPESTAVQKRDRQRRWGTR